MITDKVSIRSQTSMMKLQSSNKLIAQTKAVNTTQPPQEEVANQPKRTQSRFIKPADPVIEVKRHQSSIKQESKINDSQISDYNNYNVPLELGQDNTVKKPEKQVISRLYVDDLRIKFLESQLQDQQEIKVEASRIVTNPYKVSAFNLPVEIYHQSQIISSHIITRHHRSQQKKPVEQKAEPVTTEFGQTHAQFIPKTKIRYAKQDIRYFALKQGRLIPQILCQPGASYFVVVQELANEIQNVIQRQKEDSQTFDALQKELSKYSVVAIIKQIVDKSFADKIEKLNVVSMSMQQLFGKLNELVILTESTIQFKVMQQRDSIEFIKSIAVSDYISEEQVNQVIYYSSLIFAKQLEFQEEQLFICQQFIIQFNQGVDSVLILYEFVKYKTVKLNNKLEAYRDKLSLIQAQTNNDVVLQSIFQYILKLKQKRCYFMKRLVEEVFTEEQIQMLDKNTIFDQYITYRNAIIKNPNKFTYEVIKRKPLFILQQYKLLFIAEKQINEFYYKLDLLEQMYLHLFNLSKIESQLLDIQKQTQTIRLVCGLTLEQPQYRDKIMDLRNIIDILLAMQNQLPILSDGLPLPVIRMKQWIQTEVNYAINVLQILNGKLHSIDLLSNQLDEQNAQQLIARVKIVIEQINKITDEELNPNVFDKDRKVKLQSKEQEIAVKEIYNKYIIEEEKDTPLKMDYQLDKYSKIQDELTKGKDSFLICKESQKEINEMYNQMNSQVKKYTMWEHMNACRYLMNAPLLSSIIEVEQQKYKGYHTITSLLSKLQSQFNYFKVNPDAQGSKAFTQHLKDGITLLTFLSETTQEYVQIAEKNVAKPGSVNIDKLLDKLNQFVTNFFKVKNCTLLYQKESLMKSIQIYIGQTTQQFGDSSKAAELDVKFSEADTIESETDRFLTVGCEKFMKIYTVGAEAVKDDFAKSKKAMTIDSFKLNLGYDETVIQLKAKSREVYNQFLLYQSKLNLTGLPVYQNKLEQKLEEFNELQATLVLFEKTIFAVFTGSIDLLAQLNGLQDKIASMVMQNSYNFILQILQQQEASQSEINKEVTELISGKKINIILLNQVQIILNVGATSQAILTQLISIINHFSEITQGFAFYQDQINLLLAEFFIPVKRWLTFYHGAHSDRNLLYYDIIAACEDNLAKLNDYPLIKMPFYKIISQLKITIQDYEGEFNKDFMEELDQFAENFHAPDKKVQNFQEFQSDLTFILTAQLTKDAVRKALTEFNDKVKYAEEPLSRMQQFMKAVQSISKSDKMKKQKKLNQIYNQDEIILQMGDGQMNVWINICKVMSSTLTIYFKNAEDQKLQPLVTYTEKINEIARSYTGAELKKFVENFLNMMEQDYKLSTI